MIPQLKRKQFLAFPISRIFFRTHPQLASCCSSIRLKIIISVVVIAFIHGFKFPCSSFFLTNKISSQIKVTANTPQMNSGITFTTNSSTKRIFYTAFNLLKNSKRTKAKEDTWQYYLKEDPTLFNLMYGLIWKIPWGSEFGRFLEGIPFLISFFWLAIWFLLHYTVSVRVRMLGLESSSSFFLVLSEFTQLVYFFCCIQAIF